MAFSSPVAWILRPRLARRAVWVACAAAGLLPAWGWAQARPVHPTLAQAAPLLEASIDAALGPAGLPATHRQDITRQGWAEAMALQSALQETGAVSPRGWINDCTATGRTLRDWLWRTDTLTGAYLGAEGLEAWGVACAPRLGTIWSDRDTSLVARAVRRAAAALPARWPVQGNPYPRQRVRDYLQALNASGGLAIGNRPCARHAVAQVRRGHWSLARARFESTHCAGPAPHAALQSDQQMRWRLDLGLAGALATPFLGLDHWTLPPQPLAWALARPEALENELVEMAVLAPPAAVLVERQSRLLAQHYQPSDPSLALAQMHGLNAILTWPGARWPAPAQCAGMGAGLRAFLGEVDYPEVLHAALAAWRALAYPCPGVAPGPADGDLIDMAARRTALAVPTGPARTALAQPLAGTYLAQSGSSPGREQCIHAVLETQRAAGEALAPALRRARGWCPVAYQVAFPDSAESD